MAVFSASTYSFSENSRTLLASHAAPWANAAVNTHSLRSWYTLSSTACASTVVKSGKPNEFFSTNAISDALNAC